MKVGVIIVTFNGMKWINKCLTSLSHSQCDLEIVVVDNASEDDTVAFIRSSFPNVLINQSKTNIGFGQANNVGLSHAIYKNWNYAFLLNQDAEIYPGSIKGLVEVAENNKDFGILSPIHLDASGEQLDLSFFYYLNRNSNNGLISELLLKKPLADLYSFDMVNAAAWLLPMHSVRKVGGFSPLFFLYGEDDNYCQRMRYHGFKIGVYPHAAIKHDSKNSNSAEFAKGSENYYQKFTNRIKIKYADVNHEYCSELNNLRKFLLKEALVSLLKLKLMDFKVNLKKKKLISNLDLCTYVTNERKGNGPYLHIK